MYDIMDGYRIVGVMSEKEALETVRIAFGMVAATGVVLFAILMLVIGLLVKRTVVRPVDEVAGTLSEITEGNLDRRMDVRTSWEFDRISDEVNATVDALKAHIDREAARINEELGYAREIQRSALPTLSKEFTEQPEFSLHAFMGTAKEVGGDFYDFYMLGIDGMTIYTVCKNVLLIMLMTTGGIIGVIPSLAGVLYGERDYYGLRAVCVRTLKMTGVATAAVLLIVMTFTATIAGMFGIRQAPLLQHTVPAMRCFMLCLPFYVWNKFLTSYYQSIEQTRMASLITFLQGGVIMLPAAYLGISLGLRLGRTGLNAMGLSFLASEGLTALVVMIYRKIKFPGKSVFILPGKNSGDCLDVTIQTKPEEVTAITRQALDFCLKMGVERTLANRMTVAAEEMMQNVIAYGGKRSEWIDFCLAVDEQQIRLRIRDNGIPFAPTSYAFDGEDFDISGIEIVKRIASRVSYVRAIDLNNTVIEINRREAEEIQA